MTVAAAEVIAVHLGRTTREVVIRCPFCSGRHTHGWPYGAVGIGSRVAHCAPRPTDGPGTYVVPTPGPEATR